MTEAETIVQRFVAVWNEIDPAERARSVRELWRPDGRHYMGAHDVGGHEAVEARVAASNQRSVLEGGAEFRPATHIQKLPGVIKFRWDMVTRGTAEVRSAGVGFLTLDAEGKIVADYLFAES